MIFFVVVPSVMIVSIILVHVIFERFGIEIRYGALAICAVLSIVIDFVAAMISPVPGQAYFIRLLALILVSAAVVTALNKFLIDNSKPKTANLETANENDNTPPTVTAEIVTKTESLEEILDYAYSEKDNGNIDAAINAYNKALEMYSDDEYAPFIAIDLGNIYKEQALYQDAIKIYDRALELAVVKNNPATQKEFQDNRAYLQTVYLVLSKHNALSTPFSQISAEHLQEIESEFQAARSMGE